jgi:IclR family KDG regulon transcriptional repressor
VNQKGPGVIERPERTYSVAAVEKALRVLEVFAAPPHRFILTEVAARSGLSTNQAFRLLQTLTGAGYVRQEAETKVYCLGHRLFGLVGALFHGDALLVAAGDVLTWVHERTGETVALIVPDGEDTICVDVRESAHPLLVAATVGTRSNHFHAGAVGKLFLAARDDAAIDAYLAAHAPLRPLTDRTPVTAEAVRAEVRAARAQGYATSEEEVAAGMYGIAAPVRDRRGAVVAAITLSAPLSRASEAERCVHREVVVEAGRRVSGNLGYREGVPVNS